MEWYAVKLLYRNSVHGTPDRERVDPYFRDVKEFFEESVLLVQANSFEAAYEAAEQMAKHKREVYVNKYGQTVTCKFYRSIDCYWIQETVGNRAEIYSSFFTLAEGADMEEQLDRRYSICVPDEMQQLRRI
jgi:hypothetical protein